MEGISHMNYDYLVRFKQRSHRKIFLEYATTTLHDLMIIPLDKFKHDMRTNTLYDFSRTSVEKYC